MSQVTILVGTQWGDEGKGKWCDIFAKDADLVARFQGGNNAGHTLFVEGKKIVLHQIPSGIFHKDKKFALGPGVVLNPSQLLKEIDSVESIRGKIEPDCLLLSDKAHVITPWHIYQDGLAEEKSPVGTTKRGIGPTYSEKSSRLGLRLYDYADSKRRHEWIKNRCAFDKGFASHIENHKDEWQDFHNSAARIKDYVCHADHLVRNGIYQGDKVLLEGAQGALLDIDHGTFPYVTSSSTTVGGAIASIGFDPRKVNKIWGIGKAYLTRVGDGPFPTELKDEVGSLMGRKGKEFGATTQRPRRCGWYDAVAMSFTSKVNGLDGLLLNKLDILSDFPRLKIAMAYHHPHYGEIKDFPANPQDLSQCVPVYYECEGWQGSLDHCKSRDDLPKQARHYLSMIEEFSQTPIHAVGTGPGRDDIIMFE